MAGPLSIRVSDVLREFAPAGGWLAEVARLRAEARTLTVTGGVLLVDGGGDPFVNTLGSFVVRVNYQQPVQAITVATGSSSQVLQLLKNLIGLSA